MYDKYGPGPEPERFEPHEEDEDDYREKKLIKLEMKNPKLITPIIEGATYEVPTYKVTGDGIQDGEGLMIVFCKGNKDDEATLRQEGVFTETLLQVAKEYLETVNKGELASRETSTAITKIDEALMWLNKRSEDRKIRGVLSTYQK